MSLATAQAKPAIVFGVLLRGATGDWLGRNQLMLALTAYTKVVLLEEPKFSQKILEVVKPTIEEVKPNLYVVKNAFGLRYQRVGKRVAQLSSLLDGKWFRECIRQAGIEDFVYWITVADRKLAFGVPESTWVYDCMDPCFVPEKQAEFDAAEAFLASKSRVVFSTAHVLYEKMRRLNPNTVLLPNATSQDTIQSLNSCPNLPEILAQRQRPFIGYMGTLDWRFEASYIYAAAKSLPEYTFVIVGRVNSDQQENARKLLSLPNVIITGQVSYEEGHCFNAAFDVGLIPFAPVPMNDAINSVKMFMYLANGLPVVSTSIEECRRNPFVVTAESPQEFTEAIRKAFSEDDASLKQNRRDFALANTWKHRAEEAIQQMKLAGFAL